MARLGGLPLTIDAGLATALGVTITTLAEDPTSVKETTPDIYCDVLPGTVKRRMACQR